MTPDQENEWYKPNSEIIFGVSAAVGTPVDVVENVLNDRLKANFDYDLKRVKISEILENADVLQASIDTSSSHARFTSLMNAGDDARESRVSDILARLAMQPIAALRQEGSSSLGRTCHLIRSLKHPDEVELLRNVYRDGFILLGIFCGEEQRRANLITKEEMSKEQADELILRDEDSKEPFGQHTRDTFHLSDVFLDLSDQTRFEEQMSRFLDILFGKPCTTPTLDEYAMYSAFTASLRSADLSRQVGAAIFSNNGECLAMGCNDVPQPGGGLYWPGPDDHRDYVVGYDPNAEKREEIVEDVVRVLSTKGVLEGQKDEAKDVLREQLRESRLGEITEYGRAVHAEMEAILSAGRLGLSVRGMSLYSTTFPCHNCAKHLVAAGISRLVYIEPYPKSRALELHEDAIAQQSPTDSPPTDGKVVFTPYIGVGPRRFFDLFSVRHGSGLRIKRATGGQLFQWKSEEASTRLPMWPSTYYERESIALDKLKDLFELEEGGDEQENLE